MNICTHTHYARTHAIMQGRMQERKVARPRTHTRHTYNVRNIRTSIKERARCTKTHRNVEIQLYIVLT